jgi:hypothetical protein
MLVQSGNCVYKVVPDTNDRMATNTERLLQE